ncbi:MAG: YhbY family RNA-binding protein [Pseudomonadota bacterium]
MSDRIELTNRQKRHLKAAAHNLNPVVAIGNKGITDSLIDELNIALAHHELIKIKLPGIEKSDRSLLLNDACQQANAHNVSMIGRIGIVYKAAKKPKITLPE